MDGLKNESFSATQLLILAENEIKTRDGLADLASEELIEIIGENILEKVKADEIIMSAREHWFDK